MTKKLLKNLEIYFFRLHFTKNKQFLPPFALYSGGLASATTNPASSRLYSGGLGDDKSSFFWAKFRRPQQAKFGGLSNDKSSFFWAKFRRPQQAKSRQLQFELAHGIGSSQYTFWGASSKGLDIPQRSCQFP
jgi:hypothetical protein